MKQKSFFSQLYYSGCSPSLIIEQLKSGIITESDIKKSSVKDFVQYLSSMTENVPHKEQEKINELMDIYIQDNKKINTIKKIKGNDVSFLAYLLIHVPLTINNLRYLIDKYDLRLNDNNEMYFLPSHIIRYTNFSTKHKSNLLLFFNDLNIDLSLSTIKSKNQLLNFYFNTILQKDEDLRLKSFISFDLNKFKAEDYSVLFEIINNLPFSKLKNKYDFIQDEIKYIIKKLDIVLDNSFDNIKKLCIQDERVFRDISFSVNNECLSKEDACVNFCQFYLFNFIYENFNNFSDEQNLLNEFLNTINSFPDSFYLNILDALHSYTSQPLKFQTNSDFIDIEKQNKIKKDKEEKFLPLFNYLKIKEEQIKIKESIKDFEKIPQTQKSKKRI